MIQWMLAIWFLIPLPFLNPSCTPGSSQFTYCWRLSLKYCDHNLTSVWNEYNCTVIWTFFSIPVFAIGMKTDLFQSYGRCWVFQICWRIECSTLSFRIWNSSAGIPSPPLAMLLVKLPKALLTSHSRISDSRWVITPSWLSGSLKTFLYCSSVYFCHLVLIS